MFFIACQNTEVTSEALSLLIVVSILEAAVRWLSVKALAGPCRTEPTIVTEVGLRRITIFGTGFYNLIKSEVIIYEL